MIFQPEVILAVWIVANISRRWGRKTAMLFVLGMYLLNTLSIAQTRHAPDLGTALWFWVLGHITKSFGDSVYECAFDFLVVRCQRLERRTIGERRVDSAARE